MCAIEVGALAEELAAALLELLVPSLASAILQQLGLQSGADVAQEHVAFAIESTVVDNQIDIRSDTHGLAKIASDISTMGGDYATILNRLDAIDTSISNIPVPAGSDANAAAVWGFKPEGEPFAAWDHLSFLERYADLTSAYGCWPWRTDPRFAISGSFKYPPD